MLFLLFWVGWLFECKYRAPLFAVIGGAHVCVCVSFCFSSIYQGQRYEGFMQTMRSALLAPNFTEYGFGLARCPDDLLAALQAGIHDGLPTASYESNVEVILGNRSKFIRRPDLTQRVLQELRHYAGTCMCTCVFS